MPEFAVSHFLFRAGKISFDLVSHRKLRRFVAVRHFGMFAVSS
jgi:hypothetical protein